MHLEEGSRVGPGSGFPVLRRKGMRVVRQQCPQAGIWVQSQGCVAQGGRGGRATHSGAAGGGCPGRPLSRGQGLQAGVLSRCKQELQEQEGREVSLGLG